MKTKIVALLSLSLGCGGVSVTLSEREDASAAPLVGTPCERACEANCWALNPPDAPCVSTCAASCAAIDAGSEAGVMADAAVMADAVMDVTNEGPSPEAGTYDGGDAGGDSASAG